MNTANSNPDAKIEKPQKEESFLVILTLINVKEKGDNSV
jgi:hypothetical protein